MLNWDDLSSWTVFLIDDEPDALELVGEYLEFRGMQVEVAANGLEGWERLSQLVPTIILTDLSMPRMDGWTLRAKVKTNPQTQHIPMIAMSAHAMIGDKERALAAGFDGYLTKPVNIPTLLDDLKTALQETHFGEEIVNQ